MTGAPDVPASPWHLPPELVQRVARARRLPLARRIDEITRPWLGLPYSEGPLGEAGGPDPDPEFRYDTFDCLTFVEEALALALGNDIVDAQRVRMGLRYRHGGPPTYENRRHFMLAEWIRGTVAEGWTEDITPTLPGVRPGSMEVSAETWRGWSRRSLFELPDERLPVGRSSFHYLPLDAPPEAWQRIPPGSLLFTLRRPSPRVPIAVTHVGITVPASVPTMRHASRMGRKVVRDDTLAWTVAHLRTYTNWPVAGLVVLRPREAGPLLSRLDGPAVDR